MTARRFCLELELARADDDRRRYILEGVGSLRLEGWLMRAATLETPSGVVRIRREGLLQREIRATVADVVVGTFEPRGIRRGGILRWRSEVYTLRPDAMLRERYLLAHGDRELALIEARGWWGWGAKSPVRVQVDGREDPELLLFACFSVRSLADSANSTAGTTAAVTTITTAGSL